MEIELVNYVKSALAHGLSETEIKQNLLDAGWEAQAVEESFAHVRAMQNQSMPAPSLSETEEAMSAAQGKKVAEAAVLPAAVPAQSVPGDKEIPGRRTWPWWGTALAVLAGILLLAGGAFAYYSLVVQNPDKIWDKFLLGSGDFMYRTEVSFTYNDSLGSLFSGNEELSASLPFKDFSVTINGNYFLNSIDSQNAESAGSLAADFSSDAGTSLQTQLDYILKNNVLYVQVAGKPLIEKFVGQLLPGQDVEWLKLDLSSLAAEASGRPVSAGADQNALSSELAASLKEIWNTTRLIGTDAYLGKERIGDVQTLHFRNTLDIPALKDVLDKSVDAASRAEQRQTGIAPSQEEIDNTKYLLGKLVDKISVQAFETWIGLADARLYKLELKANIPSPVSAIAGAAFVSSQAGSQDATKLGHMNRLATALELFYNDYGGYPEADTRGQPIFDPQSGYIPIIPQAPGPATGMCSDYYNAYWYLPTGNTKIVGGKTVYDSYEYSFCLGQDSGDYQKGIARLTPRGIESGLACVGSAEQCPTEESAQQTGRQKLDSLLDTLGDSASIHITTVYSGYGKKEDVNAPGSSTDILDLLNSGIDAEPLTAE